MTEKKTDSSTENKEEPQHAKPKRKLPVFSVVLVIIVLCLAAAGLFFGQQYLQQQEADFARLQNRLSDQQQMLQTLERALNDMEQTREEQTSAHGHSMAVIEQRLKSVNKRLLSIAGTDRDDWRLAEAEYLLHLANQRILIERDSQNALALLESADKILRDLHDVDLIAVRQALLNDLTALKLAVSPDREGIFLRLSALSEQVGKLPFIPVINTEQEQTKADKTEENDAPLPQASEEWWKALEAGVLDSLNKVTRYVRIQHHDQHIAPVLPPDSQAYLYQNLRFMFERAQLAVMREQPQIYTQSLEQIQQWLIQYFPLNEQTPAINAQLLELQSQSVRQELPDISHSLVQLKTYIEQLHKLESVEKLPEENSQ